MGASGSSFSYGSDMIENIFIVAGHSDTDPGAIADDGTTEREITVDIARRVVELLRDGPVSVTGIGIDESLTVKEKVKKEEEETQKNGLNYMNSILVSIHCDWKGAKQGCGAYHYAGSQASSELALQILRELKETSRKPQSNYLLPDTKSRFGRLGIIRDTRSLSCLVEVGTLAGEDLLYLKTEIGRQEIAKAICMGIDQRIHGVFPKKIPDLARNIIEDPIMTTVSAQWRLLDELGGQEKWAVELKTKLHEVNETARMILLSNL